MNLKSILLSGVAAAAFGTVAFPALADNISTNQWYSGQFTGVQSPLVTPGYPSGVGTNGPVLGGPNASAVQGPGTVEAPVSSWSITMNAGGGYLTITDVEELGDQFQLFDNGVAMTPTATLPLGGQAGQVGGDTSAPQIYTTNGASTVTGSALCGEDISCALSNADYSSGTFALGTGTNVITATLVHTVGPGSFDFITEQNAVSTPEPATFAVLGMGLAGLAAVRRRKKQG